MPQFDTTLVWFRRDLRNFDHAALHYALAQSRQVYCVFIFDKDILESLPRRDRRVEFIHDSVHELDTALQTSGGGLIVRHARAIEAIPQLAEELGADAVFANRDYEPAAVQRDEAVAGALTKAGRALYTFKDQVIFERGEVLSQSDSPFSVFTPYKNAWLKKLHGGGEDWLQAYDTESEASHLAKVPDTMREIPSLQSLGFEQTNLHALAIPTGMSGAQSLLDDFIERMPHYQQARDYPAVKGPSYLSVHLRFGTVSIRGLARIALDAMRTNGNASSGAATWLSELIWREFYFMILHHHPHVAEKAFKPAYDAIRWETGKHADQLFQAWCEGRTGYPLIDAAMAQINQTGYMHNRLRMVVASFLIKDLGIDWRWGECYFAEQLNDFDLSANNGGWQWAASSGCDAQPYFRIFNPITQSEKFDEEGKFIRRYLPQLGKLPNKYLHAPWKAPVSELQRAGIRLGIDYPEPIITHDEARARTLERYAVVKKVTKD
ncbi:deoxyribodipyrimidine photo-lyase [uncultured Oxalicibacterium sp.]|uniref:cryptochrome/photolyase family protein n=1 Tax=uncultured Oxalicibacterium sp. TaxID=1168540 RepID=UPI0025D8A6B7|nr:deoxyribodipyrimidine photo-lyase [uncultured Oxalicibacterium sp.]